MNSKEDIRDVDATYEFSMSCTINNSTIATIETIVTKLRFRAMVLNLIIVEIVDSKEVYVLCAF